MSGNLVGTVVPKIGLGIVKGKGDIPQLLGFAVKAPIVAAFLDSNGIAYGTGSLGTRMDPANLATTVSVREVVRGRRFSDERSIQPRPVRDDRLNPAELHLPGLNKHLVNGL